MNRILMVIAITSALMALDRITFDDGSVIECRIAEQTAEAITYEKNGRRTVVDKNQIKAVELDIDVDKFYIAALAETDTAMKIKYLKRSITLFKNSDKARALLEMLQRKEAERNAREEQEERGRMAALEEAKAAALDAALQSNNNIITTTIDIGLRTRGGYGFKTASAPGIPHIGGNDYQYNGYLYDEILSSSDGTNWATVNGYIGMQSHHGVTMFDGKLWILGGYDAAIDSGYGMI